MTDKVKKIEKALKHVGVFDDENVIKAWNDFSESRCSEYDEIYDMGDINDSMAYEGPEWIVYAVWNSDHFCPFDRYYTIIDNTKIVTFDFITDDNCPICFDDLAQYMVDTNNAYGIDSIQEILNEN